MPRRWWFALAVLTLGALGLIVAAPLYILPVVTPVLAPVLPRPVSVPKVATAQYDFKSGTTWRWQRRAGAGCITWMAQKTWASVNVRAESCQIDRGVSYSSIDDHLVFQAYWTEVALKDVAQKVGTPCPHSLTPVEVATLRQAVRQAAARPVTNAERIMLLRVDQRLAWTDGAALTSDPSGWCNDLKPEDYRAPGRPRFDFWR